MTSNPVAGPSRKRDSQSKNDNPIPDKRNKSHLTSPDAETYSASGLKLTLHGVTFQLKLLLLFMKRALLTGSKFRLATEMDAAEKFDDVVLQQFDPALQKYVCRFVQAKHKHEDAKQIHYTDLKSQTDGEFGLLKYFYSFCKIKENQLFADDVIKDFTLCTNIGLNIDDLKRNGVTAQPVDLKDDKVFFIENSETLKHQLNLDPSCTMYMELLETSDLHKLAKMFAETFCNKEKLNVKNDLMKIYSGVFFAERIIDRSSQTLTDDFCNDKLSDVREFRQIFERKAMQILTKDKSRTLTKDKSNFWSIVRQQKLSWTGGFDSPNTVHKKFPINNVTASLVAEFFDRFFIITNLPNEQDLDIVIRKELGENISLLDPSLIYSGLLTELLNWLKHTNKIKHSEGTFISESEANNLMESIETKLSELVVSGITRDIVADVSEIQFKFDDINQSLKDFARTGSTVKVLFLESSPNARFGTAKVVQVLLHNGIRNYIVVTLDTLLKLETLFASAVLNGNSENFLILECDSDNQKYSAAQYEQAFQMLNRIANKLILVAQEDNSFTQLFIKLTVPDATKFQQLCDKSQDSFLNRELSFQGVRTNIRSVVKEDVHLVTDTLFTQLFENEEISIDCNNEWMVRMPDFIPRTLCRSVAFTESELIDRVAKVPEILVAVHGRVMSELVVRVLNQKLKQRLNDDSFVDRFFFIKSDGMDDFRERNNGLAMVRVKQLSHDAKFLVEEMISNGLDDHEKYKMFTAQEFLPRTIADFSKFKNENILLVGEAGMGKSTYLNELAYRTKADEPYLWITKINLNDYTDILKEASDGDTVDYETLLIELATDQLTEDYERIVFCKKYNDDEVVLILDGLDEISPTFSDMSIGLLNFALEQPSKKLIVATRLHLCDSLRSHLQEDAFYFQPLTVTEQKIYLKMKWLDGLTTNSSFTEDSFDLFINTLFTNIFSQKQNTKISSVPLLLSFIAEIFKTDFRLFHDTLDMGSVRLCSGHYNIVNLYDDFIDLKVRRYKEDKNRASTSNVGTAKLYEIVCPVLRDALQNVALRQFPQFYSVDHLGILDEKVKNLFPHEELIRVGLLQSVRANFEGLHFVHFSFTEYFIAEVLAERCEKFPQPGIFQTLLDISPNVSMFFDLMLSRGLPLHLAILLDDRTQFEPEKFDKSKIFLNSTDRFGRSPLHLAIDKGLVDVASELVAYGANINVVTTMPFGHDRTPLIGAMFLKDSFQFVKFLSENKAYVNQSDRKLKAPLHFAAELGQYISAELLLQRHAKVNAQDSSGKTPLHIVFARRQKMPLMPFISLFQEYVADFNMLDNRGRSVMFHACRENLYFEHTEDEYDYDEQSLKRTIEKGETPDYFEAIKFLVGLNVPTVSVDSKHGNSCILELVGHANYDIIRYFIFELKSDICYVNGKTNENIVHSAVGNSNAEVMKLCIEALREQQPATWNDFLNAQERYGQSPLMLATRGLANDCAKLLINDYGVDLNLGNISGETALHIAVQFENVEILKLLLTKNASIDIRNYRNETAADQAEYSLNTIKGIFPNRAKHRRDISNANVDLSLTKN